MIQSGSSRLVVAKVEATRALSRSTLSDYVVNPYLGCQHGCKYCYVQRYFRSRTSPKREWGNEVHVRTNIGRLACREANSKTSGKVLLSSMTDPYQPLEAQHRLTREVIECLVEAHFPVNILTKSNLVLRDLDLLAKRDDSEVMFSLSSLDEDVYGAFEPGASPPEARVDALREVLESGIKGGLFIAPHIPAEEPLELQYGPILERASELGLRGIMFDFLNYRSIMKRAIMATYESVYPQGKDAFHRMLSDPKTYERMWRETIQKLARKFSVKAEFV